MITLLVESAGRSMLLFALLITLFYGLRIRNKSSELSAWRVALLSAFLIPAFLQLRIVSIPAALELSSTLLPVMVQTGSSSFGEWSEVLAILYVAVAMALTSRLALGIFASWRLYRSAHKSTGDRLGDSRVLISDAVTVPVTVGSVVLLPADCLQWSAYKLQAVLAHETAHARSRDFYWHVAALLYRAIFWINPLAWWLPKRMAELAEIRCDRIAVDSVGEPTDYAQLLVDFCKKPAPSSLAVAMARSADLQRRVEQLLGEQPGHFASSRRLRMGGVCVVAFATAMVCVSCDRQVDAQRQAADTPSAPVQSVVEKEPIVPPRLDPNHGSSKPEYIESEFNAGHQGTVYLQAHIAADGRVAEVRVKKSSGYEALDLSALTEVRERWRFLGGTENGVAVDMWVTIPIIFAITPETSNATA